MLIFVDLMLSAAASDGGMDDRERDGILPKN